MIRMVKALIALFLVSACVSANTKEPIPEFQVTGFPEPGRSEYFSACTKGKTATYCLCVEHYSIAVWGDIETIMSTATRDDVLALAEVCMEHNANYVEAPHAD